MRAVGRRQQYADSTQPVGLSWREAHWTVGNVAARPVRRRPKRVDDAAPPVHHHRTPDMEPTCHQHQRQPRHTVYPDKIDGAVLKVAGVVVLGAIMSILDITVVNVALPTFQVEFGEPG